MSSTLQPYAVSSNNSRGRAQPIELARDRNEFQRDYTRILHSRAFRRLQGKTQVFPAKLDHFGQSFRTRMSHSFEVEQISRSVARFLGLNQDLAAVVAIGHDIGHPPFGHMGQDILNERFSDVGGFEHNHQALRLVDEVESPYPGRVGLNLVFETREGLLKHCSPSLAKTLGSVAQRHLDGTQVPLEVQLVDSCDQLAYLYGDLEDALDHGLLTPERLYDELPGFKECWAGVAKAYSARLPSSQMLDAPETAENARALLSEVWRRMLSQSIEDLSLNSRAILEREGGQTLDDVRSHHSPMIRLSDERITLHRAIREFSRKNIYQHPTIVEGRAHHAQALGAVIDAIRADPSAWGLPKDCPPRKMCDMIAMQTDTVVLDWYEKQALTLPSKASPRPNV